MSNTDDTKEAGSGPLEAGWMLDQKIAEKMGYVWESEEGAYTGRWIDPKTGYTAYDSFWQHQTGLKQPQYSSDIEAAFELVEFIRENISKYVWVDSYQHKWIVQIRDAEKGQVILAIGRAETAPLAICRAFLAMKLEEKD